MQLMSYRTEGGIRIQREISNQPYRPADNALAGALDTRRGVLFSSSFEFPGRYTRWDLGFVDPPVVFTARGRRFMVDALNQRGRILLDPIAETVSALAATTVEKNSANRISGEIEETKERFPEEHRSRQPSVFSVLRALAHLFASSEDQHLGFYGAFGYDLVFQFEPMPLRLPRPDDQRDLVRQEENEVPLIVRARQPQLHWLELEDQIISERTVKPEVLVLGACEQMD